jgi:hypothetical protein
MPLTDIDKHDELMFELKKQHAPPEPTVLTRDYWTTLIDTVANRLRHRRATSGTTS